jgi:hypothetical protein
VLFGLLLGSFWWSLVLFGLLLVVFGALWASLGGLWCPLGCFWWSLVPVGLLLDCLWPPLARLWVHFGSFGVPLGSLSPSIGFLWPTLGSLFGVGGHSEKCSPFCTKAHFLRVGCALGSSGSSLVSFLGALWALHATAPREFSTCAVWGAETRNRVSAWTEHGLVPEPGLCPFGFPWVSLGCLWVPLGRLWARFGFFGVPLGGLWAPRNTVRTQARE